MAYEPVYKKKCLLDSCTRMGKYKPGYCDIHYHQGKHYGFIGDLIPCPTGKCLRYVARSGLCLNCGEAKNRQRPKSKARIKEWRKEHMKRPEVKARHLEYHRKYDKMEYYERGGKEKKQRYYTDPAIRPQYAARTAKRRAQKLKATPKWADLEKIKQIYQNCPQGYEVDHKVPLQGKNVCGLHVEWNLQYLPATENRSKGNRFDG